MKEKNFNYTCWEALEPDSKGCGIEWFSQKNGKRIPLLIKKSGVKRVIGRKILETNPFLGSYGMGGPGFFGLKLEEKSRYPKEWLVLTVWEANAWLLVNNKWLSYPNGFYTPKQCFIKTETNFSKSTEQINSIFINFIIADFKLHNRLFKIFLQNDNRILKLELPSDLRRLPPCGNGCNRKWYKGEKLENGLIISHTKFINI